MNNALRKNIVLVLNKNWQAVNTTTPEAAFGQMAGSSMVALDVQGDDYMIPTKWEDWLQLPVRENDFSIGTARGKIRIPTVVVCSNFSKMPMKRPKFGKRSIYERDGGICQYTKRPLDITEANLDHVQPRSRGGANTFDNVVLCDPRVNTAKANKTPEEAGLQLIRKPSEPRVVPVLVTLRNSHQIPEWDKFLIQN
jgi:5-methylcytosine-specific restriction endonuclease McrA